MVRCNDNLSDIMSPRELHETKIEIRLTLSQKERIEEYALSHNYRNVSDFAKSCMEREMDPDSELERFGAMLKKAINKDDEIRIELKRAIDSFQHIDKD
jgi:hypothetical protein